MSVTTLLISVHPPAGDLLGSPGAPAPTHVHVHVKQATVASSPPQPGRSWMPAALAGVAVGVLVVFAAGEVLHGGGSRPAVNPALYEGAESLPHAAQAWQAPLHELRSGDALPLALRTQLASPPRVIPPAPSDRVAAPTVDVPAAPAGIIPATPLPLAPGAPATAATAAPRAKSPFGLGD